MTSFLITGTVYLCAILHGLESSVNGPFGPFLHVGSQPLCGFPALYLGSPTPPTPISWLLGLLAWTFLMILSSPPYMYPKLVVILLYDGREGGGLLLFLKGEYIYVNA